MSSDDDFGPVERGGGRGGRSVRDAGPERSSPGPSSSRSRGAVAASGGHDGFGPPARGRGRRRVGGSGGGRRVLRLAVVLLLVLALALLSTGVALALFTSSQIEREQVDGLQPAPGGRTNVLVVGSDSREGLSEEELVALGTEQVEGRRTDTIFLLSFSGGRAAMLSFPRDLYVTSCDGTQGRINAAYNTDGPSCLVDAVSRLSGIPISGYLEVNFVGFLRLVEAVGGVDLYLEEPLEDAYAGISLPAGCVHLDGRQALGFVRARHVDDDLGRIARQQRFIRELATEVTQPSTLLNVPRLFSVAGAGASSVIADQGFGLVDLAKLGRAARGLAGGGLATYTVPATPDSIGGAAVLVPNDNEAGALFAQFRDGSILDPPTTGGDDGGGLTPDQVTVEVLNGAGVAGLAAQGETYLAERGFTVAGVGNAEPVDATVVRHPDGMGEAAALVASQVPGATVEESSDVDEVTVVLGPDADLSDAPAPPPAAEEPAPAEPPATEPPALGAGPVPADC